MAKKTIKTSEAQMSATDVEVDLYLADDVRVEADGKVTAVGLYTDSVIVLLVPPEAPDPSKDMPYVVGSAAILLNIRRLSGEHEVAIRLGKGPDLSGGMNTRTQVVRFDDKARSANLVVKFNPLLVLSFGIKTVVVTIDGVEHERTFEIRRGDAPVNVSAVAIGVDESATGAAAPVTSKARARGTKARKS